MQEAAGLTGAEAEATGREAAHAGSLLSAELERSAQAKAETDKHYSALRARLLKSDLTLLEQVREGARESVLCIFGVV